MMQISELHDASSKPWIQLSSFTVLVFLLLTQNYSGLSQVVGPSQPVLATVGDDVLLPCRLEPAVNASDMSIEWSREGPDPTYVYMWSDRKEDKSSKHADYKRRTSLLFSKLEFGDVSLKLSKVKLSDEGKYECFIPTLGKAATIDLVVGAVSFTVISLAGLGRTSSSVELQCESAGWYPEPELLWLDGDGNLLSAGPTETVRGPDDLYTVSSRVTVEKKHNNKFTCRVQQNKINQSREALIQVTDDFFKVQSKNISTIVGLGVSLTVAFILLVLVILLFLHTRRQKSEMQEENEEERQENENLNSRLEELERNHLDTSNQLQQERQENENLNSRLEELERNHLDTSNQLQQERQENENLNSRLEEWIKIGRELKTLIQKKTQELDEMNFDTNSDSTGSDEKNQQEEKWMKTVVKLKTELQNMNKKLELIGPITVEVDEQNFCIHLKNISSEEINLEGWKLELQKNDREPGTYTFDKSLKSGKSFTIWRSKLWSNQHPDDWEWAELKNWDAEDKLQINLISNKGETFRLL